MQHAIVTGGSRGIGREVALAVGRTGSAVTVNYRSDADSARSVVDALADAGARGHAVQADVTDPDQARRLLAEAERALGTPDVLVLNAGVPGFRFSFFVLSAAPQEVVQAALEGIVPVDHIIGTEFEYDAHSGEVQSIRRVPAGYGKVAALESLEARLGVPPERTVYIGDGSSDVHVMLHVNNRDGFTIAVSENRLLARIAHTTVLSDNAFSVLIPILERIAGWRSADIRRLFAAHALQLQEWEKARTDRVIVVTAPAWPGDAAASAATS